MTFGIVAIALLAVVVIVVIGIIVGIALAASSRRDDG